MRADWFNESGPDDYGFEGRCNAPNRRATGGRCRKGAGWGTDHEGLGPCKLHGGAMPSVSLSARLRAAGATVVRYGVAREGFTDPRDALLEELNRTLGHIDVLEKIVQQLELEELTAGVSTVKEGERPDKDGELVEWWEVTQTAGVNVWVQLLLSERRHLKELSADIVKLGLLQRAIEIEQAQAALLGRAVTRTLDDLGLSSEQRLEAQRVLAGHLRELDLEAGRHPPGVGRQGYG